MSNSPVGLIVKLILGAIIINYLMTLAFTSTIVAVLILILGFALLKRWFPFMFNTLKKISLGGAKFVARMLWQRPERKGGATIRSQKIRWRP